MKIPECKTILTYLIFLIFKINVMKSKFNIGLLIIAIMAIVGLNLSTFLANQSISLKVEKVYAEDPPSITCYDLIAGGTLTGYKCSGYNHFTGRTCYVMSNAQLNSQTTYSCTSIIIPTEE